MCFNSTLESVQNAQFWGIFHKISEGRPKTPYLGWFGWLIVLRIYIDLAIFPPYLDLDQEITNLWKFKWRGRESNPGPLAPKPRA